MTYSNARLHAMLYDIIRLAAAGFLSGGILVAQPAAAESEAKEKASSEQDQGSVAPKENTDAEAKAAAERAEAKRKAIEEYDKAAESLPASAGAPECVWTGQRIASLLWRDDIDAARRYMELYNQFACSPAHLKLAFRCVIRQGPIDPKAAEELASRVYQCWIAPKESTAGRTTGSTTKGGTIPN